MRQQHLDIIMLLILITTSWQTGCQIQMKKLIPLFIMLFFGPLLYNLQAQSTFSNNEDSLSTGNWWKLDDNPIINLKVNRDEIIAFGIYTTSKNVLKLTAQFYPLLPNESRQVHLNILVKNEWRKIASSTLNDLGWNTTFKIENWDNTKDTEYRITHDNNNSYFQGLIRKDPRYKNEIVIAALSCNSNRGSKNRSDYIKNIEFLNPDLIFFAGDQSYSHDNHTAAWLLFGEQFHEIFRNRPCITIPDDHDVGQGNLWGESGKKSTQINGKDGGYFADMNYVKMVERTQTSHLPDPFFKETINNELSTYYTDLEIGHVSIAILEDRKFKPSPNTTKNLDFDDPSLTLLGKNQLSFLNEWALRTKHDFKLVLSQTGFADNTHYSGGLDRPSRFTKDSNGWPVNGRNEALRVIKKANAIHIGGDTHLATFVQHGIEEFDDGPWSFIVPAIQNDYHPRWWLPDIEAEMQYKNLELPHLGRFYDDFNNKISMHAYANPAGNSYSAGFGIVRLDKKNKLTIIECWDRYSDVENNPNNGQMVGWPIVLRQENNRYVKDTLLTQELQSKRDLNIFPNPFNEKITIKVGNKNIKNVLITIFDLSGKIVYKKSMYDISSFFHINTSSISIVGFYIINLEIDGRLYKRRLYKM